MDVPSALRVALVIALIAGATTFVSAFSACGMLASKVLSCFYAIFLFGLAGFFIFNLFRAQGSKGAVAFMTFLIGLIIAGGIVGFIRLGRLYTFNSTVSKLFISLFIVAGLSAAISLVLPAIISKLFTGIIPQVLDSSFIVIIIGSMNLICSVITALLIGMVKSYNEDNSLKNTSLYSILSVLISAIVGAIVGVFIEFKAESTGYTPSQL